MWSIDGIEEYTGMFGDIWSVLGYLFCSTTLVTSRPRHFRQKWYVDGSNDYDHRRSTYRCCTMSSLEKTPTRERRQVSIKRRFMRENKDQARATAGRVYWYMGHPFEVEVAGFQSSKGTGLKRFGFCTSSFYGFSSLIQVWGDLWTEPNNEEEDFLLDAVDCHLSAHKKILLERRSCSYV